MDKPIEKEEEKENEIYIHPEYDECGRPYYNVPNARIEENLIAVCLKYASKVIPVIFLPGVMGSNLKSKDGVPVWLVNSQLGVAGWISKDASYRKRTLDPQNTDIYDSGAINNYIAEGRKFPDRYQRGWGEVAYLSYGHFLPWLQLVLDDERLVFEYRMEGQGKKTARQQLIGQNLGAEWGEEPLTAEEVGHSYRFMYPVHVMGYNWLQSNADSAKKLAKYVDKVLAFYGKRCAANKVILVTHSMGGLVARHYSEKLGGRDKILGIVHGVMPDTGSPMTYKRMKTGEDGITGMVIGSNGAEMTPVLAQSPGPLQLLPGKAYGKGWLHIADGKIMHKLPESDPYQEIYLEKSRWWGLCETRFLNPDKEDKWKDKKSWSDYLESIKDTVKPFIEGLSGKYHPNTYAFYGVSEKHLSYGIISWREVSKDYYNKTEDYSGMTFNQPLYDPFDLETGTTRMVQFSVGPSFQDIAAKTFKLAPPEEKGDGTVPEQAGRIPTRKLRSQLATDVDHEGAYNEDKARLFTLRSIVKMVQAVKIE
ncbi:esterase/lipase family protein [Photorhabdus tasmaniensis]|uniref:esterase/lipase family protein n=1 Tax=Photorhabdus tasmaniensis TaxID=1004159 RepID=UPI004041CC58